MKELLKVEYYVQSHDDLNLDEERTYIVTEDDIKEIIREHLNRCEFIADIYITKL